MRPEPMTRHQREKLAAYVDDERLPADRRERLRAWLDDGERTMENAFQLLERIRRRLAADAEPAEPDTTGPPPWLRYLPEPTADREGTHA